MVYVIYNRKSYVKIKERIVMIFKVFYQENVHEVPVREKTKTLYIQAESVREVYSKLADKKINIEYIQEIKGAHLEYEQQNENYKVLEI
jgi:DNA-dependent RNA polymerase auxiliary subunit epsilon